MVTVSGKELLKHFASKAKHHQTRADFYKSKLDKMPKVPKAKEVFIGVSATSAMEIAMDMQAKSYEQAINKLQAAYDSHKKLAAKFEFFRTHTPISGSFQMAEYELIGIELL